VPKILRMLSFIRGLKNLLGVGPHLLLLGLFLEGLTIIIQQWVSFPIRPNFKIQILLTIPCVVACLLGACLSKVSPAGKKCDLPSSGYRISSINQEIRWETLSAGSDNLCPQAIF